MLNISQIFPNLSSLEQNRQSQASRYKLYKILIWVSVIGVIFGAALATETTKYPNAPLAFWVSFALIWVFWWLRRKLRAAYINQTSEQIFAPLIKSTLPNVSYNHKAFVPASIFNQSGLFLAGTSFQGEDLIEGQIDGIAFKCSQLTIYKRVTSKSGGAITNKSSKSSKKSKTSKSGKTTTSTNLIFQGFFVVLDMPTAQTSGQTLVQYNVFEQFGDALQMVKTALGNQSAASLRGNKAFEGEFEKIFNVKTDEPQVLTSALCEFLTQLNRRDTKVGLSITSNRVCMSMETKADFLATDITEPVSAELLQTYANEWEQTLSNIRTLIKLLKPEQLS
jgi:Protein of unknown function (DUF3137)